MEKGKRRQLDCEHGLFIVKSGGVPPCQTDLGLIHAIMTKPKVNYIESIVCPRLLNKFCSSSLHFFPSFTASELHPGDTFHLSPSLHRFYTFFLFLFLHTLVIMAALKRFLVLIPLILSLVAFVLTNLALFAGHQQGFMEDYAVIRVSQVLVANYPDKISS